MENLFTVRFNLLCEQLSILQGKELDDTDISLVLDTSITNARRYRQGTVVPPAKDLLIKLLEEYVDKALKLRLADCVHLAREHGPDSTPVRDYVHKYQDAAMFKELAGCLLLSTVD